MKILSLFILQIVLGVGLLGQSYNQHLDAAKLHRKDKSYQKAIDEYNKAIPLAINAKNFDKALEVLEQKNMSLMFLSQTDSMLANSLFTEALIESNNLSPEKLVNVKASIAELYYIQEDFKESIKYYRQILGSFKKDGDDKSYASTLMQIGDCYRIMVNSDSAFYYFDKALPIMEATKDSMGISKIYVKTSQYHLANNNFKEALDYSIKSVQILDEKKHSYFKIGAYQNISSVFQKMKNTDKAIEYSKKGIALGLQKKYVQIVANMRANYGELLIGENKLDSALVQFNLAEKTFSETNKAKRLSGILYSKAKIAFKKGNKKEAKSLFEKSLNTYDYQRRNIEIANFLAKIDIEEKQYQKAEARILPHLDFAKANNLLPQLKQSYQLLATVSEAENDYLKANNYLRSIDMLKDSLYNIETNQVAQTMVAEFQFDQQEKEIKLLNSENQVKALELESANKQKLISYAVIGGLGLASLLLYFFFNAKKKSNQLLEEKNIIISNALKEKDTLLREIHHRVKNNLQVIGSLLRLQSNYTDDENVLQAINEGQSRVRSMALIHQKLYQRENLTGVSTKDYLDQLIKELFLTYKVDTNKIQLELDIQDINLDIDTVIPIGLVVNELVSNALKYAFVGRDNGVLKVSLKEVSEKLVVKVADNGNGIPDLSVVENPSSFGWNLINIFKDKLDGSINIDNTSGTSVEIKFEEYQLVA